MLVLVPVLLRMMQPIGEQEVLVLVVSMVRMEVLQEVRRSVVLFPKCPAIV